MGLKITLSIQLNEVIEQHPAYAVPIDEFKEYKIISVEYGDNPNPPRYEQEINTAHIDTIGRDKAMTHPIDAKEVDLHHVHMWQEGCKWNDENGNFVQWASTSDSYVVYSYFLDKNDDHHYYVIDYCKDKAHELIEDEATVLKWASDAKEFKKKNI